MQSSSVCQIWVIIVTFFLFTQWSCQNKAVTSEVDCPLWSEHQLKPCLANLLRYTETGHATHFLLHNITTNLSQEPSVSGYALLATKRLQKHQQKHNQKVVI